jgi:hypothetical protein
MSVDACRATCVKGRQPALMLDRARALHEGLEVEQRAGGAAIADPRRGRGYGHPRPCADAHAPHARRAAMSWAVSPGFAPKRAALAAAAEATHASTVREIDDWLAAHAP